MDSNYSIPIVQGTAVPSPGVKRDDNNNNYNKSSYSSTPQYEQATVVNFSDEGDARHNQPHEQQPSQFRDALFAVAFVLHLGAMLFVISLNLAEGGGDGGGDDDAGSSATGIATLATLAVTVSVGLTALSIGLMMRYPTEMIKAGLISSAFIVGAMAVMFFLSGSVFAAVMGLVMFLVTLYYIKVVWQKIPFAAANLKAASSAISSNMGILVIASVIIAMAFAWTGLWLAGMSDSLASGGGMAFLFLVSFYWTFEVFCNTIRVTTAGTVGTWWFVPGEANGCWSTALRDSFCRATTYSFGSICLGSLLIAVVRSLRALAHQARQNEDMQLLYCLIECILSCIEDIIEYFNKWAYVYVGLYGFGYVEAGRNVVELFKSKGWSVIITDDLNERVFLMMSVGVGVFTGLIGMVATAVNGNLMSDFGDDAAGFAFWITFLVGFAFCRILMSVFGAAVDTVIVCFAESPAEFEANHPALSQEMRSGWTQSWPELRF
eukprot:CAMPEP_0197174342 /NCGR_PEP_ID=MMETSP1423-20130617/904_1 /TAXON_ID=476441 /ORGANISM="Pseudo-nitzschia heimii, Strain UNC1101" /LENGTH=490 /DNA_ID=CAMNT_0042623259 /DNA_START=73 /DNA_END=1545 /DNA_ORIENTATION=+